MTQSEVFFGDKVDKCYKCVVKQGHTLFVPTGKVLIPSLLPIAIAHHRVQLLIGTSEFNRV